MLFISTSDRRVKRFAASEIVIRLIPLLNGTHTLAEIIGSLCGDSEELAGKVGNALAVLREERLLSLTDCVTEEQTRLTPCQIARYQRQIGLFQDLCDSGLVAHRTGVAVQERLMSATVVILGAGGLGSVVATALAAAGIGTLIVCDPDVVELSNLSRQVAYSLDDLGADKAGALAARLGRLNPDVRFGVEKRMVREPADLAAIAGTADLVISCADQPSVVKVAEIVTEACWPDTPHFIGGSYSYHVGLVGLLVVPGVTACWHCLIAGFSGSHGRDKTVPFVAKARYGGIVGAQSGIVGNMIAWEATRFLIGMTPTACGECLEFNYQTMSISRAPVRRRASCPWCADAAAGARRPFPRPK